MNAFQRSILALPLLLAATGCDTDRQDVERTAAERLTLACLDVCVDDEDCDRCDAPEGVLTFDAESGPVVAELLGLEPVPEVPQSPTGADSFTAQVDSQAVHAHHTAYVCAYTGVCAHNWVAWPSCASGWYDYGLAYATSSSYDYVIVACNGN